MQPDHDEQPVAVRDPANKPKAQGEENDPTGVDKTTIVDNGDSSDNPIDRILNGIIAEQDRLRGEDDAVYKRGRDGGGSG